MNQCVLENRLIYRSNPILVVVRSRKFYYLVTYVFLLFLPLNNLSDVSIMQYFKCYRINSLDSKCIHMTSKT